MRFTAPSPWTWVGHLDFGYITTYFVRPFQTRFRCGSGFSTLTLHVIMTRRFILQEAPSPINGLRQLVGTWFQELFHSPPGVLFTSPSRYWFTIGLLGGVFSLARWSSRIPTGFHVSRRTQDPERREPGFVYWTITIWCGFPATSTT